MTTEQERIREVYGKRGDQLPYFSFRDDAHFVRTQQRDRLILLEMARAGYQDLASMDVLDIGCGRGTTLLQLLVWSADPSRLHGIDVRPDAVAQARAILPDAVDLRVADAQHIDCPDESIDLVWMSTVMSSILDTDVRASVARECERVLRPGGAVVWYDLAVPNPRNRDVRPVRRRELRALFAGFTVDVRRTSVLPPIGARLPVRGRTSAYALLAAAPVPMLRSHLAGLIVRNGSAGSGRARLHRRVAG